MAIIVNIDVMLAKEIGYRTFRKVGITMANISILKTEGKSNKILL